MKVPVLEFTDAGWEDARLVSLELALGPDPSRAVVELPYDGGESPPAPEGLEVKIEGERVFAGTLRRERTRHENESPHVRAVYEDARSLLARFPCPGRWTAGKGGVELREGEEAVFNRDGEGDKAPGEAVFSDDPASPECWSGRDVIRFLEERALSLSPLREAVALAGLEEGSEAARRLARYRPMGLACGGRSLMDLLAALAVPCGLEMRMDFSSEPPALVLFAPFREGDGMEADAGTPGGRLDPARPPDLAAFEAVRESRGAPPEVVMDGILPELEITLQTNARYTGPGKLEECDPWKADLVPDWTPLEQKVYDRVYLADPWEKQRALDGARRRLWYVERRYRVNPAFAFHAFFDGCLAEGTPFVPAEGFSRLPWGEPPPPEVVLELLTEPGWRQPFDERGKFIGVTMLEGGRVILFDRPISAMGTMNPRTTVVRRIGYTLCLRGRSRAEVKVRAEEAAPGVRAEGPPVRKKRRMYRLRVIAPDLVRKLWKNPVPGTRDDRPSLTLEAAAELERRIPRPRFRCVLHGLRPEYAPGNVLERITFDAASGGRERGDLEGGSLVRRTVLKPGSLTTVLECGGAR